MFLWRIYIGRVVGLSNFGHVVLFVTNRFDFKFCFFFFRFGVTVLAESNI